MIERYNTPEFKEIWSERTKYREWFKIEYLICKSLEEKGMIPEGVSEELNNQDILFSDTDIVEIVEIEKRTKHDVIAFLTFLENRIGSNAKYIHKGITSSDITDTYLSLSLVKSADVLISKMQTFEKALNRKVVEHRNTLTIGRTHGIHAELITFGQVLSGYSSETQRNIKRLQYVKEEISFGKISGAVGTYAHFPPECEEKVLKSLGLRQEVIGTQVIPRDRHAIYFSILAIIASGFERFATNIRHLQRTEVQEVEEPFSETQKGSSAMPHKRNPIISENICGLARMVKSCVQPALENIPLWHERDISHSSVERMIAPDATSLLGYIIDKAIHLVTNIKVHPNRMISNMARTNQIVMSEAILIHLTEKGIDRQKAYVWVQRNAMKAYIENLSFIDLLKNDADIVKVMNEQEIEMLTNPNNATRYCDQIIDRVIV